jgi:hypothetical protein
MKGTALIENIPPMAEPAPPWSPVAAVIALWPATSWVVAKRPKERMLDLVKYILNRSEEIDY